MTPAGERRSVSSLVMACPVCTRAGGQRRLAPRAGLQLSQCDGCGLVYATEPPASAELERIYRDDYYRHWADDGDDAALRRMKLQTAAEYVGLLARHLPAGGRPRLLDIGCAHGTLLEAARAQGFEAAGIEISAAGDTARGLGFTVYDRPLEALALPSASFDAVTLIDVAEHLPELPEVGRELNRILRPGGVLLMVTPDVTSGAARLLGGYWPHYKREHLVYFSPRSLRAWLEGAGLAVLRLEPAFKHLTFGYVARHFARYTPGWIAAALTRADRMLPRGMTARPIRVRSEMLALARSA